MRNVKNERGIFIQLINLLSTDFTCTFSLLVREIKAEDNSVPSRSDLTRRRRRRRSTGRGGLGSRILTDRDRSRLLAADAIARDYVMGFDNRADLCL